jgi:hypothetical protein
MEKLGLSTLLYCFFKLPNKWSAREKILHCRGARQGDPLSPMLFLLAMKPLHRLFQKVQEVGLMPKLSNSCHKFRDFLYADDAAIFIQPSSHELQLTQSILQTFVEASGLITNISKTEVFPIQCDNLDLSFLLQANMKLSSFPCSYLGLPPHFKKLPRAMFYQVIQKIGNILPSWKRGFMSYPGNLLPHYF